MAFNFDLTLSEYGEPDLDALRAAILAQCRAFGGTTELAVVYDRDNRQVICRLVPANGVALGRLMQCFNGTGINGAMYFSLPVDPLPAAFDSGGAVRAIREA